MNFKEFESKDKLRGGYYTPLDLAQFLVRWIAGTSPKSILEPSCGDGVFFDALRSQGVKAKTTAIEFDEDEARKADNRARSLGLKSVDVINEDFLGWSLFERWKAPKFDAVIGNPPFIRYQYLPKEFQLRAEEIFNNLGCKFTKHTNAWVSFLLAGFDLLKPGGRMAMVVPSEIIHVMHAQSLRTYFGKTASKLVIVDPEEIWFEGTLQGAVLLLAEKKKSEADYGHGLGIYAVKGRGFLSIDPEEIFQNTPAINGKTVAGKWTRALLGADVREVLDDLEGSNKINQFSQVAGVDVGIVTGANKFFLVDDWTVEHYGLERWAHPMFGRSEHCPGVLYDERQHTENSALGKPTNFLWLKDSAVEYTKSGRAYIELGEQQELHKRYKCRIRSPWYTVPSVYSTEVGMLKRSHDTPRLILNELGAYTTDTAYRIRTLEGTAPQLVYGFLNALTALSAELEGRHYGGGVLELVPSEIEKLLLPSFVDVKPKIKKLDQKIRHEKMAAVLESQTNEILGQIGISTATQEELLSGWQALRNRRHRVSDETSV